MGVHLGPEQRQSVLIVDAMRRTAAAPQLPPVRLLTQSERQHLRGARRRKQKLSRAAARRQVRGRPEDHRPIRSHQRARQPSSRLRSPHGRPEVHRPVQGSPRPQQPKLRCPAPNHHVSRPVAPWYFTGTLDGGGEELEEGGIGRVGSPGRHAWLTVPTRRIRYRSRGPLIRSPRLESVIEENEGPAQDMCG